MATAIGTIYLCTQGIINNELTNNSLFMGYKQLAVSRIWIYLPAMSSGSSIVDAYG
jgi:hypothetical protein